MNQSVDYGVGSESVGAHAGANRVKSQASRSSTSILYRANLWALSPTLLGIGVTYVEIGQLGCTARTKWTTISLGVEMDYLTRHERTRPLCLVK
jgi:hypothetical protein